MPIYEYECRRCSHRFELLQKHSDKPRKRCPECSGAVDRLMSAPAIRFKGSGWYVTDYAGKGKPDDKSSESEPGSKKTTSEKTTSEKKEKKAAAKDEKKAS